MYIITGLGRSGTSFIAEILKECGYNMGHLYNEEINAGWELHEIVSINKSIMTGDYWGEEDIKEQMRKLSNDVKAVKDPNFIITLKHWIDVGANIEGVYICKRDYIEILKSSNKSNAGLLSMFGKFDFDSEDCHTATGTIINIMKELEWLCQSRCVSNKIYVEDIRYPKSVVDFSEVQLLNKIVQNEELLKEVWEKVRDKGQPNGI